MKTTLSLIFCLLLASLAVGELILDGLKRFVEPTVKQSDVKFELYTRNNPDMYIKVTAGQLRGVNIDPTKPFKFIIHGYTHTARKPWVIKMKDAYLEKGDYNVVGVDWSGPALWLYSSSAGYTKDVGKFVGQLIMDLMKTFGVSPNNFHLVGHSLGAHVCGFAGKYVQRNKGVLLARITAMDPAGPLFNDKPPEERLSSTDAQFVDAIHTDGKKFGYYNKIAVVDFYPNGGTALQPGCILDDDIDLTPNFFPYRGLTIDSNFFEVKEGEFEEVLTCSHSRAYMYFTESINSTGFIAKECSSQSEYSSGLCDNNPSAIMGEYVNTSIRGVYYLNTDDSSPFAKNGSK